MKLFNRKSIIYLYYTKILQKDNKILIFNKYDCKSFNRTFKNTIKK